MYGSYPHYRVQRLVTALTALAALCIGYQAHGEAEYGLGQLVPGRYLTQVRKGSEDKLPEIEGSTSGSDLSNFKSAPRATGSVPRNESFYSNVPAALSVGSVPAAVPSAVPSAQLADPASNAAQTAFRDSAAAVAAVEFRAGSLGDARGPGEVTGLGAGWGMDGNREELGFGEGQTEKIDDGNLAPSPKQNAAERLLASVQVEKPIEDDAAAIAQQVDRTLNGEKGEGYRALASVLSFQEMPRGAGGTGTAEPKVLWNNPDPASRVKSTQDALNTMHAKDPVGQAAASYRRTPNGVAEATPAGRKPSTNGEAGAIGQSNGIYQSAPSNSGTLGQAPAAVPFQMNFPFPIPGQSPPAESSN